MTELFLSGPKEPQSDDSQETGHREPEKGDSPNPNSPIMTFGELLKRVRERGIGESEYDESGTSELPTPRPTGSSDPSTTWEVVMIPKKRRGSTRDVSSQNNSADPQQQAQE